MDQIKERSWERQPAKDLIREHNRITERINELKAIKPKSHNRQTGERIKVGSVTDSIKDLVNQVKDTDWDNLQGSHLDVEHIRNILEHAYHKVLGLQQRARREYADEERRDPE
jgi:hypothetical protein